MTTQTDSQPPVAQPATNGTATVAATPDRVTVLESERSQLIAENTRLSARLRSLEGTVRSQRQYESLIDELRTQVEGNNRAIQALANAQAAGNADSLPGDVARIQSETAQVAARNAAQVRYANMLSELQGAVQDEAGKPVLDLNTAPELQAVRDEWQQASQRSDWGGLTHAISEAHKIVRRAERAAAKAATDAAVKAERDKRAREDLDLDAGKSASGNAKPNPKTLADASKLFNDGVFTLNDFRDWKKAHGF